MDKISDAVVWVDTVVCGPSLAKLSAMPLREGSVIRNTHTGTMVIDHVANICPLAVA